MDGWIYTPKVELKKRGLIQMPCQPSKIGLQQRTENDDDTKIKFQ
jgi:hypothetical protein